MKLRNKQTGEIVVFGEGIVDLNIIGCKNVAEMIDAGWTDYEEPKDIWWLDNEGNVNHTTREIDFCFEKNREIGNYFETREEAEKAVEKLKAWKRLKDIGFEFKGWKHKPLISYHYDTVRQKDGYKIFIEAYADRLAEYMAYLDLLFGGEDEQR